jgi:DNA-binding beta-propeller fold protein YncE
MSRSRALSAIVVILAWARCLGAQAEPLLRLTATIPLPDVQGRIDHFSVDVSGSRLFMSALGNNTVEVVDLKTSSRIHSITGLHEPQGVLYVPEVNKLFVANGEGGACDVFEATSFKLVHTISFSDDADNIRYDRAARLVYVGYGAGALSIIDSRTGRRVGDIRLAAHPESFQLEPRGVRVFVNVPRARHITVIDRAKRTVLALWTLPGARDNFPMALDAEHRRLFVGTRTPPSVFVLETDSGRVLARVESTGDADDMFYDAARSRIYVSGGEGFITVINQDTPDRYHVAGTIPTAPGARTSFFVPELARLYVAVPRRESHIAAIRVYQVSGHLGSVALYPTGIKR